MNITIVVPELNPTGGIRVISIYARELRRRGHTVELVKWKPSPRGLKNKIKFLLNPPTEDQKDWYFEDSDIPIRDLGFSKRIEDEWVPDADIVIATWYDTAEAVARLAPSKGAKFYFMQDYGAPGQPLELLRPTWRLPMHFITISESLVRLIREEQLQANITLVPNAVDTGVFKAPRRGKQNLPTFGFIYRSMHSKGADVALSAFDAVRDERPGAKLMVVGHDDPGQALPIGAASYKGVSDEELALIYASCDAWLFPSRSEGFGLPILEAMACRTPVISTPTGAAPELLADAGILVPVDDPEAMAKAMIAIIDMTEGQWAGLSNRAYARAVDWSWKDAVDRFEAALGSS